MSALVKKEIRLLLPSWIAAVLLALPPICTRSDDGIPVFLLFMGLAMMALTSIGRETSLNTFSSLFAQPAERTKIWKTKLSVLTIAFSTVFAAWHLAIIFSFKDYGGSEADPEASEAVLIAGSLALVSAFTGGLWATLLLRQIAGAFWLTLLMPAVLAGFTAAFLAENYSNNTVIAILCIVLGIYSVGGFLFARWLFFRAQDVGWTGGIIDLPNWNFFTANAAANSARKRKPIFALLKKEFQLQQISLLAAAGLLVLHIGAIVLRAHHKFPRNSAGEILTSIFWMLWLILPVVIGAMAVADERRLGVMEGQLCLPVSRRVQFVIKGFLTLVLGTLLGGVLPMLLEIAGPKSIVQGVTAPAGILLGVVVLSFWLSLVSFFASSLAKNFLQAIGFAIATFSGSAMMVPAFAQGRMFLFDSLPVGSILPLVIAVPTLVATLLWLAYLNFKNFRDGWHLWRRSLLVMAGAMIFVLVSSAAIYNRAWEMFEPLEPAHGAAKLSLANPPSLQVVQYENLLIRLPDGRVWFDVLGDSYNNYDSNGDSIRWKYLWRMLTHPLPESAGPQQFLAGSNWVAATTERLYFSAGVSGKGIPASGFMDTVGIQPDGTLWFSENPEQDKSEVGTLQQFGSETNWHQLAQSHDSIVLLKNDGTLWRWGSVTNELHQWPGLHAFTPYQIGTNSDWQELFTMGQIFARQKDGRVWQLNVNWKTGRDELSRATNYDEIISQTASRAGDQLAAFVRPDGTLWVLNRYWNEKTRQTMGTGALQVGKENGWLAVAVNYGRMVALKSDGSLWQWHFARQWDASQEQLKLATQESPTRLGIHDDWVAIASTWDNVIALAADGSLWLWPNREFYEQDILLKLPKQPQFLGNVFSAER